MAPEAEAILRILETMGIFMIDVHPANIAFLNAPGASSSSS